MAEPLLLLFDIDGTLLGRASIEHRDAIHQALHDVHGVDATALEHTLSPAGRTDGEIARLLLLAAGVSARRIDERADAVRERSVEVFVRLCPPSMSERVLPRIPELLDWLSAEPGVRLSLVTGNFEPIARLKLRRAGIGRHFPPGQGGFGSDDEDRTGLPHLARLRAGAAGIPYPRARTIVIGDTPRDIACARADELRCFAVATGPFSSDELSGADAVVRNASGLRPLLEAALAGD